MAHEKVYGFCENKCKVEVAPKTEVDAFDSRIKALENTVPEEGAVRGFLFVRGNVGTAEGDEIFATLNAVSGNFGSCDSPSNCASVEVTNYQRVYELPKRHCYGVYTREEDLSGSVNGVTTRTLTLAQTANMVGNLTIWYKKTTDSTWSSAYPISIHNPVVLTVNVGDTYQFYCNMKSLYSNGVGSVNYSLSGGDTYYVKYDTP